MNGDELIRRYQAGQRRFPETNLRGAKLAGAQLSNVELTSADLSDADLSRAGLEQAYLPGTFRGAKLSGADLDQAYLVGADLTGADLTGATLRWAVLAAADLRDANLTGANLENAFLGAADLPTQALDNAQFTPEQLEVASFPYRPIEGKVSLGELIRAIRRLPPDPPFEWRNLLCTQKDHWLSWLGTYHTAHTFGPLKGKPRDAEYVYNHINNAQMLFYLIKATHVRHDLVADADRAVPDPRNDPAQCATIRRIVPWEAVVEGLFDPPPSRSTPSAARGKVGPHVRARPQTDDYGPGGTREYPENWDLLTPEQQHDWETINRGEAAREAAERAARRRRPKP